MSLKTEINAQPGAIIDFAQSRKEHPCVAYESGFLGSILTGNYRLEHDFGLKPDDFFVPRHKVIWSGVLELMRTGFVVDAGSLYTWATAGDMTAAVGGYEYVHTHLRDAAPLTLDANSFVGKILEAARVRRIRDELRDLIMYIDSNPFADGTEIASEVEKRMFGATQHLASVGVKSMPVLMESHKESFERRVDLGGRPVGIPIGIGPLDKILGGYKPGSLNGLMAAPGIGKSALMLSTLGYLASRKVETVVFSLEMNVESLLNRAVAAYGKIPLNDVQNGTPSRAADVRRVMDELSGAETIHLGDAPSMSIEQIGSELRRLKAERGRIDLVWIDHLHIVERTNLDPSGFLAITKGLKRLAAELGCAIVGLLHLNAAFASRQDKRPLASDIKYLPDGDFDTLTGLYRDEVYNPDTADRGVAEILVRKHRNGETGMVLVQYIREMTRYQALIDRDESSEIVLPWEVDALIESVRAGRATLLSPADPMGDGHIEYGNVEQPTRVDFATLLAEKFGREEPAYPDEYPMPEQVNENLTPISTDGINDFFDDQFGGESVGYDDEF